MSGDFIVAYKKLFITFVTVIKQFLRFCNEFFQLQNSLAYDRTSKLNWLFINALYSSFDFSSVKYFLILLNA